MDDSRFSEKVVDRPVFHVRRTDGVTIAALCDDAFQEAIKIVARLHAVEKDARGKPFEERAAIRQAKAKHIFDDLEAWLHAK